MPLCRQIVRSLLHSRAPRKYLNSESRRISNVSQRERQSPGQSAGAIDLSKVSADSAYLDYILGPRSDVPKESQDGLHDWNTARRIDKVGLERRPSEIGRKRATYTSRAKRQDPVRKVQQRRPRSGDITTRSARHNQFSRAAWRANQEFHRIRSRGTRLQSKFVSIKFGSSNAFFSRYWNSNFALLQSCLDSSNSGDGKADRRPLNLNPRTSTWVEQIENYLKENANNPRICKALHKDSKRAVSRWLSVALWFLYHDPARMIGFLKASNSHPYPPLSCVEDSFQYLAKLFSSSRPHTHLAVWQELYHVFVETAQQRSDQKIWMQSSFFRLLMLHCTDEQIKNLYHIIKIQRVRVSWHTYLHFATYLAKNDHFDLALDAILEAQGAGAKLDSYAFRSNCATLLRTAIRRPGGLRVTMRIVDNLVKIGLPLNTQLCNIVMLNAVEAGDLKTMFSVYNSLVEHGLEADVYTYSILLKGCKANIDDVETLNTAIHNAIGGASVVKNVVLATEILHCLALHHTKCNPANAYQTVADAYSQIFDTRPVQELGLPLPEHLSPSLVKQKLQPNQYALNIMLATYLDQQRLQAPSTRPIHELYQRFRLLVESGKEPFNLLAETDHAANIFLEAFTRTKKGLLYAAEVIKHMQRPLPVEARVQQCPPSVQSWSIFLHGFTRHGQLQLAEQVIGYMRAHNLQPNHVTWTSLISGYAAAQDIDRVLDTIRRGEADGAVWDDWTVSGIRRLIDQRNLQEKFRKQRLESSLDFTDELRESLGTRLITMPIAKDDPKATD